MFALIIPLGNIPGMPDNSLPGFPGHPSQGLPASPGHPDHGLPGGGGHPSQGLPPLPPDQAHPGNPIVLPPQAGQLPIYPVAPDNTLPQLPPGVVWPPLPPQVPQGKALALVAISGVGYRWTMIDTSLTVGWPMPAPK